MPQKTVGDLMHKGIIACGPEIAMDEVVRIVNDTSVHAIVVMDRENRPLGMVTHMDIIRLFSADLSDHVAREVMSDTVIAIESNQPAQAGADLMLKHNVDRLLVIEVDGDQRTPVGMLSTTDLVNDMRGVRWIWHVT
jgi:predicted transcriptional regulator